MANENMPHIRFARLDDIPALCDLLQELFTIESDFQPERARQHAGLKMLLKRAECACVLVAEEEGVVIGMCTAQVLVSTAEGKEVAMVEDVVVRADKRGRGIGAELMTALEEWCRKRGLARMQLLADRENFYALKFYETCGWNPTRLIAYRRIPHSS